MYYLLCISPPPKIALVNSEQTVIDTIIKKYLAIVKCFIIS